MTCIEFLPIPLSLFAGMQRRAPGVHEARLLALPPILHPRGCVFPQPVPLAPPSSGEGKGESCRAGREVPSGTVGPGCLWQHQKCHQACSHVSPCPPPPHHHHQANSFRSYVYLLTQREGEEVLWLWCRGQVCPSSVPVFPEL